MENEKLLEIDKRLEEIEVSVGRLHGNLYSAPFMFALEEMKKDISNIKEKLEELDDLKRYLKKTDYYFYTNFEDFRNYFTHDIEFENRMKKKRGE